MSKYLIKGGYPISGEIIVSGAKNAVLPIMTASILVPEVSLENVPRLSDVKSTIDLLRCSGCKCAIDKNTLYIDSTMAGSAMLPHSLSNRLRSSVLFLGAMLSRFGEAAIAYPGGCDLGGRPIDMHLEALRKMGAEVKAGQNLIYCRAVRLRGTKIRLAYPSVGATENILMAAVLADGVTTIENAAKEPEICNLVGFLNKAGAKIRGEGTAHIIIEGVSRLMPVNKYRIMPDRIEAGTFMAAAAVTGGELYINGAECADLKPLINIFRRAGAYIRCSSNALYIASPERLKGLESLITAPYPGLPTDMQAPVCAAFATAKGKTEIKETVFKGRIGHISELNKMGADIRYDNNGNIFINGQEKLYGAEVRASDLRAGAALIAAGLAAEGTTIINETEHIKRGYENIVGKIAALGGNMLEID